MVDLKIPKGQNRKQSIMQGCVPEIHSGIDPPVRNPTQSFVKELQLKSDKPGKVSTASPIICMTECTT